MMKLFVLCGLLAVAIAASSSQKWRQSSEPFRAGHEYIYHYKSQIASGIGSLDQHSTQLLTSKVLIHFESERVATLRLRDVKVGVRNDPIAEPRQLQHTQTFEDKEIESEQLEKLQMPIRFDYVEGLVESINFHDQDSAWSKNIKRAVLNLLQINLKRRSSTLQGTEFEQQQQLSSMEEDKQTRMFTIPETTLEGYCQTVYTINSQTENDNDNFNVTKSIDFNHCKKLAFVRYGPRIEVPTYETQQQKLEKIEIDAKQQLDRSTVFRFQLTGTQEKFGLGRAEVISQYVYRLMNAEAEQPMQTVVVGELTLRSGERKSSQEREVSVSQKEDTLLYSLEWDNLEKRFFQYGDDEFSGKTAPFHHLHNKVQMIIKHIQQITQDSRDQEKGISVQSTIRVQEAAELVRMCTVSELKKVMSELEQEQHWGIFADICAIAGTRNSVHFLVEQAMERKFNVAKTVQALRQLNGPFTVSSKTVDEILRLCKSDVAKRSSPLRQSCWLTFGSMVHELCKHSSLSMDKEVQEQCPRTHQEKYHNMMISELRDAESTYEKVLALKTIGNAGLHKSMFELEKLINKREEHPIVRQQAIDALRRFRTQMPVKVQRILLPVFKNVQERPEIRMAAFSMIMYTIPQKTILDQVIYTLHNERSQHVRSFVYTTLRAYSQSTVEVERELAKHLQSVLKMAQVNEDQLRSSRFYRIPIYSQEQREGLLLNLATGFASSNIMPHHMSLSMDTLFNGLLEQKNLELTLTQTNLEQLVNKLYEHFTNARSTLRSNRRSSMESENGREFLENIFDTLKIKRGGNKSGFGMLSLRVRDIDYAILPLSEESMSEWMKEMSLSKIVEYLRERRNFRFHTIATLHERVMKIATTAGLPLRMSHAMPIVASVEGQFNANTESSDMKANLHLKPMIRAIHTQKMELWAPFVNTGVEILHSIGLNTPVKMHIATPSNSESDEKVKVTFTLPENNVRLVELTSLPLTFTRNFNSKTQLHGEPQIKTIRNQMMEGRFVQLDSENKEERTLSVHGFCHKPSIMTSYRHWYNILTVTENHVTVEYRKTGETPETVEMILEGKLFRETEKSSHRPEYKSFFENSNSNKKNNRDVEDDEDMENTMDYDLESDETRRSKFNKYISDSYRANKVYEHKLRALFKTIGGRTQHRAEVGLKATCDSHMTLCKIQADVKTPSKSGEEWTMKIKSQILTPEWVKNVEQLKENKQNKLAVTLNCEWGSENQHRVNLRIEGERAVPQQWTEQKWQRALATAFINKYDIVADYKVDQKTKHYFTRVWNMVKGLYYWNIVNEKSVEGKQGEVKTTIIIDPMTRKYVNMTIKTPTEFVRINNVVLPMTVKPFTLIRPQEKSFEIHSTSGLYNKMSDSHHSECRVDGRKVKTFDSVVYKAPLGDCYSVIAKDCQDKTFVVLMKTLNKETQEKKVKIVNNKDVIEIESRHDELKVKVNGQQTDDTEKLYENGIDYNDELVRVTLPQGVVVRFDGKQANVKLSKYYQSSQCGLCGQWNDEEGDEFQMNDDTQTDNIKDFHRSYSMLKGDDECEVNEHNSIYNDDSLFEKPRSRSTNYNNDDDEDENDDDIDRDDDVESYRHFDRKSSDRENRDREDREDREDRRQNRRQDREDRDDDNTNDDDDDEKIRPVMRTKTMEYNHKLCFSMKAVKQCPRGTYADNTESNKIQFACLSRSSPKTRRLLRQARNGDITSEIESEKPSFYENVRIPIACSA